jgi:hypothetical protein
MEDNMESSHHFHLLYRPADATASGQDQVVNLIDTDDVEDVLFELRTAPELVALHLDAQDLHEAAVELRDLGFCW